MAAAAGAALSIVPAVAGAALVNGLLFQPVRRRIQLVLDRRVRRRTYETAHALAAFQTSLRTDEVGLDALAQRLLATIRDVLHPAREAIGMDWVTFHTFRHTCASLLFEKGRNIKQVSEWLGHTDPSFTLRTYVHLMDGGIGDAAFFDEAVAPAGGNTGATEGTDTAASASSVDSSKMALQSENAEQP
jgi:hypothetical protein